MMWVRFRAQIDQRNQKRETPVKVRRLSALLGAIVLTFGVAGAAMAASVTPVATTGNFQATDCPAGTIGITITPPDTSGTAGGVTVTVTYNADKTSLDFTATGGKVWWAIVKGGDAYNTYTYPAGVTSDTDLVAPLNNGNQQPAISHSVFCVKAGTTTTGGGPTPPPTSTVTSSSSGDGSLPWLAAIIAFAALIGLALAPRARRKTQ
jgi:hypothetical protein